MKLTHDKLVREYGTTYLLTDNGLLNINYINYIDIAQIEQGVAVIYTSKGECPVTGIAALELIWLLKPSALEGKRLTWRKNSWIVHNLIAHPLMQIFALFGWYKLAMRIHDGTVPKPIGIINDTTKAT